MTTSKELCEIINSNWKHIKGEREQLKKMLIFMKGKLKPHEHVNLYASVFY